MRWLTVWCALAFSTAAALAAPPPLPAVNLVVQIRIVRDADMAPDDSATTTSTLSAPRHGQSYGTSALDPRANESQELRVLNGESASFRWSQSVPFQWRQAAAAGPSAARGTRAGIVNAVTWLQAGRALFVQPHWPGGSQPVRLQVRLESDSIGERPGDELPATSARQSGTTLSVPMGRWTTLAVTGSAQAAPSPGSWSTQSSRTSERQWLQVRVIEM